MSAATDEAPECPHGIALARFCAELHIPDVNVAPSPVGTDTCPHGVALDKFCTRLHRQHESEN